VRHGKWLFFSLLIWACSAVAQAQEMGWIPMEKTLYKSYQKEESYFRSDAYRGIMSELPDSWDWRNDGAVTGAKDQASCGSCWAFAGTGALESHIIIEYGEELDLSEQMLVSCYGSPKNFGCNGGFLDGILLYQTKSPRSEDCYPYGDGDFFQIHGNSPPFSDMACNQTCPPICYRVGGFYTVDASKPERVKGSIQQDGPCMIAFLVYEDFMTYWKSPLGTSPWTDGVYYHASGELLGGHAVVAFGWDDSTDSYTCKNSWGESGPFGDGSFKMADGEIEEAANFKILRGDCAGYDINLKSLRTRINRPKLGRAGTQEERQWAWRVSTPFSERIGGGYWYSAIEYPSGDTVIVPEPIPNGEYLTWEPSTKVIVKRNEIDWGAAAWVNLESWIIDTEGVESEHQTRTVRK